MTRGAFNTDCDVFMGPGSDHPGLFVGTFNCRLVVEDDIFSAGRGHVEITHYLTIIDYQPTGAWEHPFAGFDPSLADEIAVPDGTEPRFWVAYVKEIIAGTQLPYWRAYLSPLPVPGIEPEGGLLFGGEAIIEVIDFIVPSGGVLLGGVGLVEMIKVIVPSGGVLLGGVGLVEVIDFIVPSGGVFLGGVGLVEVIVVIVPADGILLGGVALVEVVDVIVPSGGLLLGGSATVEFSHQGLLTVAGSGDIPGNAPNNWMNAICLTETGLPAGAGAATLMIRLKVSAPTILGVALIYGDTIGDHKELFLGVLFGGVGIGGDGFTNVTTPGSICNGAWHHLALTFDGTNGRLYLDGTSVAGPTAMAVNVNLIGNGITIGAHFQSLAGYGMNGQIGDARIYTSALSAGSISTIAAGDKNTSVGSPLHWWKCDEGSGTTLADSGSGGNSASFHSPPHEPAWS